MDIQQACVEEAALLQAPVAALKQRLQQLLDDWPEHPVLVQLVAICDRLTGALCCPCMPCCSLQGRLLLHQSCASCCEKMSVKPKLQSSTCQLVWSMSPVEQVCQGMLGPG